jgi:hypothetical protein
VRPIEEILMKSLLNPPIPNLPPISIELPADGMEFEDWGIFDEDHVAHAHLYEPGERPEETIRYYIVEGAPLDGHTPETAMRFRALWVQWTDGMELGGPVLLDIKADVDRMANLQRDWDWTPRTIEEIHADCSRRGEGASG